MEEVLSTILLLPLVESGGSVLNWFSFEKLLGLVDSIEWFALTLVGFSMY